jgi:tetratricopeptide (TPR) repeat protein
MKKYLLALTFAVSIISQPLLAQDASLSIAQQALASKDYQKAQSGFTSYINSFSAQVDAYSKKQHSYDTSNAFTKSTMFADFKINHNWAAGYYGLGVADVNLGQKDDGMKNLEMAVSIDPTYADAHYQLSLLKKEKGDKTGSCIEIGKTLMYNDTMKAAKSAYQDNFCWMCGMEFYKKGKDNLVMQQYGEAVSNLKMAATICPDSGNYGAYLGKACEGAGKTDSALVVYTQAIKSDPKSYYAYYFRGLFYEQKQKYAEAFSDLSTAIKLQPNSVDGYIHRASVCENMDNEASSIYDYKQIIRIKPDYGEAYYKLALYKQKLGQDACADFQKASDLGVDDATSYADDCKKAAAKKIQK